MRSALGAVLALLAALRPCHCQSDVVDMPELLCQARLLLPSGAAADGGRGVAAAFGAPLPLHCLPARFGYDFATALDMRSAAGGAGADADAATAAGSFSRDDCSTRLI